MSCARAAPAWLRAAVLVALLVVGATVPAARAAVRFEDWRSGSLAELADRAAREKKVVVLVITQPDWCPPCIKLNKRWLENPEDEEVARMTASALVAEVLGYDQPEAGLLAQQGIGFRGTPTVLVLAPEKPGRRLGEARRLGSVVGAPDDFPARLAAILAGHDPVAEARGRVDALREDDRLGRARALLELGDAHASRGDAGAAASAYRQADRLCIGAGTGADGAQRAALRREAAWRQVDTLTLRVRKDYRRALEEIEAFERQHASPPDERERVAYAKAWALANTGRVPEALRVLDAGLPADADGVETYLYFCFRVADRDALVAGERRAADAMGRWPERMAAWHEARGRIQRRQGRLSEAVHSFEQAVALEADADARVVYEGQLQHARRELAGGT